MLCSSRVTPAVLPLSSSLLIEAEMNFRVTTMIKHNIAWASDLNLGTPCLFMFLCINVGLPSIK
jgi:hypothetical protein